jgi:hypothetical protein
VPHSAPDEHQHDCLPPRDESVRNLVGTWHSIEAATQSAQERRARMKNDETKARTRFGVEYPDYWFPGEDE